MHSQDLNSDELSIEEIFEIYRDADDYNKTIFGDYDYVKEWLNDDNIDLF